MDTNTDNFTPLMLHVLLIVASVLFKCSVNTYFCIFFLFSFYKMHCFLTYIFYSELYSEQRKALAPSYLCHLTLFTIIEKFPKHNIV